MNILLKISKSFLIISILLIFPKLISTPTQACSCIAPPPPKEKLRTSGLVFRGTVINVKESRKTTGNFINYQNEIEFQSSKIWKGENSSKIILYTASNGAACGYNFEKNKEYIIYAYKSGDTYSTTSCNGNVSDKEIEQESKALVEITPGIESTEQVLQNQSIIPLLLFLILSIFIN